MGVAWLFPFLLGCSSLCGLSMAFFPRSFSNIPLLSQFLNTWRCEIDNEPNIFWFFHSKCGKLIRSSPKMEGAKAIVLWKDFLRQTHIHSCLYKIAITSCPFLFSPPIAQISNDGARDVWFCSKNIPFFDSHRTLHVRHFHIEQHYILLKNCGKLVRSC